MPKILIVDDDITIRTLLASSLARHGFETFIGSGGKDIDRIFRTTTIDLILLDIMLPGEDGLSICRRLEAAGGPPVILLSALGDESDRITGLNAGAGHYLAKPCSPREILAHVRAALRQRYGTAAAEGRSILSFDGWRLDLTAHELFDPDGVIVDLTDGEFALLRVFVQRARRTLSRDALLEASRGPHSEAFDRAVDVQVSRLRRKLRSPGDRIIRTIRHEGYLFVPEVTSL